MKCCHSFRNFCIVTYYFIKKLNIKMCMYWIIYLCTLLIDVIYTDIKSNVIIIHLQNCQTLKTLIKSIKYTAVYVSVFPSISSMTASVS